MVTDQQVSIDDLLLCTTSYWDNNRINSELFLLDPLNSQKHLLLKEEYSEFKDVLSWNNKWLVKVSSTLVSVEGKHSISDSIRVLDPKTMMSTPLLSEPHNFYKGMALLNNTLIYGLTRIKWDDDNFCQNHFLMQYDLETGEKAVLAQELIQDVASWEGMIVYARKSLNQGIGSTDIIQLDPATGITCVIIKEEKDLLSIAPFGETIFCGGISRDDKKGILKQHHPATQTCTVVNTELDGGYYSIRQIIAYSDHIIYTKTNLGEYSGFTDIIMLNPVTGDHKTLNNFDIPIINGITSIPRVDVADLIPLYDQLAINFSMDDFREGRHPFKKGGDFVHPCRKD